MARNPPIIILGMHRSGTSLLSRALEDLGLFLGWRKDRNHEARFFIGLNQWVLRMSGGAWDHPAVVDALLSYDEARSLTTRYLDHMVRSPRTLSYLGPWRFVRRANPTRLTEPWGWKDPRNTFTLPLWLDVFPDAKVLHISRHGVDVAQSLRTRHEASLAFSKERFDRHKHLYVVRPKRVGFTDILASRTLEGGLELWRRYLERARAHVYSLGPAAHEVSYEAFLHDPTPVLEELSAFCGLDSSKDAIAQAAERVDPSRAYAFLRSDELIAFARSQQDTLAELGYEADPAPGLDPSSTGRTR